MRRSLRRLLAACLLALASPASGDPSALPPPATSAGVLAAAFREGKVVVYAATDRDVIAPLLADFSAIYPRIAVEYHDLNTRELNDRFLDEA